MARRFRGTEEVKVDAKGRISIPAKFRRVFESADPDWTDSNSRPQLVIVYGTKEQNYLALYTIEAIEEIDTLISQLPRGSSRRIYLETVVNGLSEESEIDNDGRLGLPQKLREKIGLSDRAVFMASGDHLKLWTPENYTAEIERIEAQIPELEPGADPLSLLPSRDEPGGAQ
ncbi:division/cell wall cluster transcriptional repressor MraZ [Paracoccus aminophilus]|uniref:division/cell wall cluster transcriptional repressor MraZ n=1 Tax=Paracoccus aminophilus TaxID=34003 RepID=UPI00040345D5|nr:division/cell wall cluster transcriptional repressor MraZ [Paracoccus aminophilus]